MAGQAGRGRVHAYPVDHSRRRSAAFRHHCQGLSGCLAFCDMRRLGPPPLHAIIFLEPFHQPAKSGTAIVTEQDVSSVSVV